MITWNVLISIIIIIIKHYYIIAIDKSPVWFIYKAST